MSDRLQCISPIDGSVYVERELASEAEVIETVLRARQAQQGWRRMPLAERQALLCNDPRYSIPPYIGGNGWINLDVEQHADWNEIQPLLLESYRHFALKRMLKAMGEI